MNPNHNDHQIDRVLNALRDTTPPTGMDRRLLNILEAQSSLKSVIPSEATKSRRACPERSRMGGILAFHISATKAGAPYMRSMCGIARTLPLRWISTVAVATLVIAVAVSLTSHRRNAQPTTATTTHPTPAPAQPITTIIHTTPHSTTTARANVKLIQPQPAEATEPAEDAQLSHPAPPIPLTDQERILLRYTSRGRTEGLAQISNEHTAAKEQKEAADFQAFFTPPEIPTGESE